MPHRTFIFLMLYPLFLLLAIMCFDMISRRILFTKMYKNTKNVCSHFFFFFWGFFFSCLFFSFFFEVSPVCMIKTFLYGFFSDCHLNTKFCSRSLPIPFVLFVLAPLWNDFPGCTCYWDDEQIREANKIFLLQKKCLVWDFSVEKAALKITFNS